MKCTILHESRGRIRVHLACRAMSLREADVLEYYLRAVPGVVDVKVFDRTQDAVVSYQDCRAAVVQALAAFSFQRAEAMELVPRARMSCTAASASSTYFPTEKSSAGSAMSII